MPILFFKNFWPCWEACEVLVPWPPIEPMPLGVEAQSLNHWTSQEVQELYPFYNFFYLAALCLRCCIWDLVPQPGIEPGPPALGTWSLSHWTTREVPTIIFNDFITLLNLIWIFSLVSKRLASGTLPCLPFQAALDSPPQSLHSLATRSLAY